MDASVKRAWTSPIVGASIANARGQGHKRLIFCNCRNTPDIRRNGQLVIVLSAGFSAPHARFQRGLTCVGSRFYSRSAAVIGLVGEHRIEVFQVAITVLRSEGSREFAYAAALEDLARHQDAWPARFAAKRLEIRTPLRFEEHQWPMRVMLVPLSIGCGTLAFLFWLKRAVKKQGHSGLGLKAPPVALGVIRRILRCVW